jgi:hypothetical protein
MNPLTFGKAKEELGKRLKMCPDDPRVITYANKAVERCMEPAYNDTGKWDGTVVQYEVCLSSGCITWPRQVQTIEAAALCNSPLQIKNEWYQFARYGPGLISDADGCWAGNLLIDAGTAPGFDDIRGTSSKLKLYADISEDAGQYVLVPGYDNNGQRIQTLFGGEWIDGEMIPIPTNPAAPTLSSSFYSSYVKTPIKPVTNGPLRLYEYDTVSAQNVRALAYWEPTEEFPNYRRSRIPGLSKVQCCGQTDTCSLKKVTVQAMLRFIPVARDNDFMLIQSLPALEKMVMAIRKEEDDLIQEAMAYEGAAIRILNNQLSRYQGDGAQVTLQVEGGAMWGSGPVEAFL